ncbi:restriction endonuclease [Flavobacterium sp. B17]|uniref:nSTAND3 domain-containing NTPase n=1 Tax=Flavobacterium sp. B17 TaxID=95618 RepID=UPI0003477D87|nr:restriction endonuclease [Flavobacterium sp. B17]
MEYDFSKLNDREFENLAASIIEKELKNRVEIFKSGRDGGVDGRFWIGEKKEGIIQCKHYLETSYPQLISKLKTEELDKVKKLNPCRYIFVTSKKLSRLNKQEIKEIFQPYIHTECDIWGLEDLNTFLSKKKNQDIVERNYKLWITSASVLDILYNNAIKGRSKATIREIEEKRYRYVLTENHNKGLAILEENNVIILTGDPGIGKTTLADNLAINYIAKGYEFCDIEEDVSEAENLFRENEQKKILFYCDDFLGSNIYDAINNKKDSHIVKFINRIKKDKSKKFILTSRTNILNKAYSLSHIFQNLKIRDNEFLLTIENLTNIDKARILYNHIYHSDLPKQFIDVIYEDKRYKDIIKHRSFNPRIIEFITSSSFIGDIKSDNYWTYIIKSLNEPEVIWADYFQNQTDDCIRALTYLTVFNNGKITEDNLRNSYAIFLKIHPVNMGDSSDKSFEAVRKLATKSLLNRNQIEENRYEYVLFNPSIADFIISAYSNEIDLICNIIKALENEVSIDYLYALLRSNKINSSYGSKIFENLFNYFFELKLKEENWDFLIALSYFHFQNEKINKRLEHFLNKLINANNPSGNRLWELLTILTEFEPKIEFRNFEFLYNFIDDVYDEETLKKLLDFVNEYNIEDENILRQINILIERYLRSIFDSNDFDIDYSKHINHYYHPDGYSDYDLDIHGIEDDIHQSIDYYLDGFNENVLNKISFDRSSIVSSSDINSMVTTYFENFEPDYDRDSHSGYYSGSSGEDDIDAIFER